MRYSKPPFAWGYRLLSYALLLAALLLIYGNAHSQIVSPKITPALTTSAPGNPGVTLTCVYIIIGNTCTPITHSWQKSTDRISWTTISGATALTYTPTNVTTTTYYRVAISCGRPATVTYTHIAIINIVTAITAEKMKLTDLTSTIKEK